MANVSRTSGASVALPLDQMRVRPNRWKEYRRVLRQKKLGTVGLVVVVVTVVTAVLADVLAPYDPLFTDTTVLRAAPSFAHPLGTDALGRDMLSRIMVGARVSLVVGFGVAFFGVTAGSLLGILSGYIGGAFDTAFQRLVEVFQAFPGLLLALILVAALGPGLDKVIIALSIGVIPRTVRVMRAEAMKIKAQPYVDAAVAIGASSMRVMFRHVLPNGVAVWLILLTNALGSAIIGEATLSFLGLGVPPPHASWGRMLSGSSAQYAVAAPWLVLVPGLVLTTVVFAFNVFGDALRDVFDPRMRGSQ